MVLLSLVGTDGYYKRFLSADPQAYIAFCLKNPAWPTNFSAYVQGLFSVTGGLSSVENSVHRPVAFVFAGPLSGSAEDPITSYQKEWNYLSVSMSDRT